MKIVRYAKLPIKFDAKAARAELLTAGEKWQPHINKHDYTGSWTVLALRSPGGDHKNIVPDLLGKHHEYLDNPYMKYFPSVKKLLSGIDCPLMSARFLNLQAGAVIKEHTDSGLAYERGEARLHFPVFTNPGVEFYCENDRIFLAEGECWYLNANLPHRLANKGGEDRIHLVVDCKVTDWLKNIINSANKIAFKEETIDKEVLLNMIKNLQGQNTETANRIAGKLKQQLREAEKDNTVI